MSTTDRTALAVQLRISLWSETQFPPTTKSDPQCPLDAIVLASANLGVSRVPSGATSKATCHPRAALFHEQWISRFVTALRQQNT